MRLSESEAAATYYAVAGFVRHFNVTGRSIPNEVAEVYHRLDTYIRLSPTRHETVCGTTDEPQSEVWIGTMAAAEILGTNPRHVQRHADEIGAQHTGGRLFFRQSDVIAYAERQATHHG